MEINVIETNINVAVEIRNVRFMNNERKKGPDPCSQKVELYPMTIQELSSLYSRDMDRLAKEINAYKSEEVIWQKSAATNNAAGNLCWHITGNLQHFIGHMLGGSAYQRDREYEFNCRDIPLGELLQEIERAKTGVLETLKDMPGNKLSDRFPIDVLGHEMTVGFFLMHLLGHLNYHLGQLSYHRRSLDSI